MKYSSGSISSKWVKTKWLLKQPDVSEHVPRTMLFNKKNLLSMLSSYPVVFFKPVHGWGGTNIIRIERKGSGYRTQYNKVKSTYSTIDLLYSKLKRFSNHKSFLLQRGIHLAKTKGKPFDIRVMVQRTDEGEWVSTGIFTKIGKKGMVVTNYNQGGKIGYFDQTMSGTVYNESTIRQIEDQLMKLGVSIGKIFSLHDENFRELGLDVALDTKGKPWILEVNTRPSIYPLRKMKDKGLYNRMVSYAKQYGRSR